jgi:ketosteroid isomerase-like protein
MVDAISPPRATRAAEACRLIADALSDGDLDAALVHYEPDAVVELADGTTLRGHDAIRHMLAASAEAKLLFGMSVEQALVGADLALVLGRWTRRGTDGDGRPVTATGTNCSVVRLDANGYWRVAVEFIRAATSQAPGRAAPM